MDKELEQFRKSWKQELNSKPKASSSDEKQKGVAAPSDDVVAEPKPSTSKSKEDKDTDELSKFDKLRKQPNTLEPFLLAERLLEQSNFANETESKSGHERSRRRRSSGEDFTEGKERKRRKEERQDEDTKKENSFLDAFLADLNDINEIPFFEISLPRELALKIFKHLNATDLCRCSQVSKAWKGLAEDEVLWCGICHQMGYEAGSVPVDRQYWKDIVRQHVVQNLQLQANWKTRTGRSGQLQHVQGGVLCAANSHNDKVALGYTNGDVKFWRVHKDNEECVFKPSVSALELAPGQDDGTVSNLVTRTVVTDTHVVAGYTQGYVDVWSQEGSTNPVHSFRGPGQVTRLSVAMDTSVIAAGYRSHLAIVSQQDGNFTKVDTLDMDPGEMVSEVKLVPRSSDRNHRNHLLVFGQGDCVITHIPGEPIPSMTAVSQVYGQRVIAMDVNQEQVAFSFSNFLYTMTYGVHLFDIATSQQVASLHGNTAAPSCLNLADSPPHMLVTGCRSSTVRVYDVRLPDGLPLLTFQGHQRGVHTVQMDEWKVISGGNDGLVCVWDQRMAAKLWELHSRHPVKYAHFTEDLLITANIPDNFLIRTDEFDNMPALRYRGSAHVYDFSSDQTTKGLPDICSSTYDEPRAYNYNVRLAVPYDSI